MAQAFSRVVASGSTSVFPVPFPYIDRSHVKVFLNGVETFGFSWQTPGTIEMAARPAAGVMLKIQRVTPGEPLVAFVQGNLDPTDLDVSTMQGIFRAQEAADLAGDGIKRNLREDNLSASGLLVENVRPGEKPTDAATLGQVEEVVQPVREAAAGVYAAKDAAQGAAATSQALRDEVIAAGSDIVSQGNVPIYSDANTLFSRSVPAAIDAIRLNGIEQAGDGLGGLFISRNNGAGDRVLSNGGTRTWYRVDTDFVPGSVTRGSVAASAYSSDLEVRDGAAGIGFINPLLLLSRLKYDGYLAVRHFGVRLNETDETARINAALAERVPLKFPKALVPLFGPLDLQDHGGIIGSGEATLFQRRFSGGALIRHRAGGEPVVLQDFRLHTAAGQSLANGDTGMEFGLVTPWAQRGVLNNILIQRQYDGFHWRRGSDGVISNIVSQENVRYGFLGVNPRGVLYKCNGNYNGRSAFMAYYDDTGETGVDFQLCRSFCNQYFGWEFGADGAKQTLNANVNMHATVSSFDGFGGIRMTIPFQQLMITDHLAEYHGFAQNFRPDFAQDEAAAGLFLDGGVTLATVRGLKTANNKGPGARIHNADVELFDWRVHQNGRGMVTGGRAGLEIGPNAKVYGGGLRFTDGGTTQIDVAVTAASASGQLTGIEARNFSDVGGGVLRFANVTGAMGAIPVFGAAATVTLSRWRDLFTFDGATRITTINGGWAGRQVTLRFTNPGTTGGLTVGNNIAIAGNYTPTNGGTITIIFNGQAWVEVSRTGAA